MAQRTAVYIDGFNLYHSLLEGRQDVKWLDLKVLAQSLLNRQNDVVLVRYFTARVSNTNSDPSLSVRQDVYIRALKAHIPELTVQFGQFQMLKKTKRAVSPPPKYVEVWNREEKGSDVNLAVNLLNDAWRDTFDVALVISNDSDLAEALHLVRVRGKPVGVATAAKRPTAKPRQNCDFYKRITRNNLLKSQMPTEVVEHATGAVIHRPQRWGGV